MSRFVFQYQARAEPLYPLVAAEEITLDKWWQPASEPVRRRRQPAHSFLLLPLAEYVEEETPATGCSEWTNPSAVGTGISGDIAWNDTSNVLADDGSSATAALTGFQTSEYLQVQGFGFTVPTGAAITSVEVRIDRSSSGGTANLGDVQLMKGDFGDVGALKGDPDSWNGIAWWLSSGFGSFGGAGDTWSGYLASLTPEIVNSSDFGFAIKEETVSGSPMLSVDSMQMKVCWETVATVTMDMWWRPASEPVRSRHKLRTSEIITAPLIVAVSDQPVPLDSWFVQASEPVRAHAPRPHGGYIDPTFAANQSAMAVTLDQWFQPASEPVRQKPKLRTCDKGETYEPSLHVTPSLDSWFVPASEPVRVAQPRRQDWFVLPSQFQEENPPSLDMWFVRSPDMAPTHKPRPHGGVVVPIGIEPPHSRHDWIHEQNTPRWQRPQLPPGIAGANTIDPVAPQSSPIDWWSAIVQPRFDRIAKQRRIVSTTEGYFSPADWETVARTEPTVEAGALICAAIEITPRLAGRVQADRRLDGVLVLEPRLMGRGVTIRCKCC